MSNMSAFPKVLSRIRVYRCRLGLKVVGNRPLLNDKDNLYTNSAKMWWDENSKQIIELVKR